MALPLNVSRLQDINSNDYPTWYQYRQLMEQGDFDEAQALINSGYDDNKLNSTNFNKIINAISDMETEVLDKTNQGQFGVDAEYLQLLINELINISTPWNNTNAYKFGNMVFDNTTQNYYFAIKNVPIGILITNKEYWINIYYGYSCSFKPNNSNNYVWDSTISYSQYDMVCKSDHSGIYMSKSNNNLGNELSNTTYWQTIVVRQPSAKFEYGNSLPSSPARNKLFGLNVNYN